jgi:hypothetical protein
MCFFWISSWWYGLSVAGQQEAFFRFIYPIVDLGRWRPRTLISDFGGSTDEVLYPLVELRVGLAGHRFPQMPWLTELPP